MKHPLRLESLSESEYQQIVERPTDQDSTLKEQVGKILERVRQDGDRALRQFSQEFDSVTPENFAIDFSQTEEKTLSLPSELISAIGTAIEQIDAYHQEQQEEDYEIEKTPGVRLARLIRPFERVGIYVPKNLVSSLLMSAIPAKVAGVKEIAVCTPPNPDGAIPKSFHFACKALQINEVYAIGGAQAIGAMAYGTESIRAVNMIAGPGNAYVTAAKELVRDRVKIDMLAGPSEVVLLIETQAESSSEEFIDWAVADLKAQLEHGPGTTAYLVTNDEALAEAIMSKIDADLTKQRFFEAIIFDDMNLALELVNDIAPEHLSIWSDRTENLLDDIQNAGSVFIGPWAPVALGDYASGTNHVLPTSRNARFSGGLSVETFTKKISVQRVTEPGLLTLGPAAIAMATEEGLSEHANSIRVRMERESIA